MNKFIQWHQIQQKFQRLGVWSLPLLSIPLLGALVLANSLPSSQEQNKTVALPQPGSKELGATQQLKVSTNSVTPKQNATKTKTQTAAKPRVAAKQQAKKKNQQPKYTAPAVEIKVAVAIDAADVVIGSSTTAQLLDRNGKSLGQKLPANHPYVVQPQADTLVMEDKTLPPVVWIQPQQGGYVYVGDRWYRGKVLLVSEGSAVLAVNYVNLEQYLSSVVGSEMRPDAPIEALKAQAIAARSYAIVHLLRPASAWYNLGATQRWQVYKGIESEWNTSQHAVDATAGQVLSHQGGVVESLYAASDDIVLEAHGGRGMSQQGAYKLAAQGYNHQQILQSYYPGVTLARLERQR